MSPTTFRNYRGYCRRYLSAGIGRKQLRKVTTRDVDALYQALGRQQLDAADTYLALAHGQPVDAVELAHAIGHLTDIARQAPSATGGVDRSVWTVCRDARYRPARASSGGLGSVADLALRWGPLGVLIVMVTV